MAYIIEPSARFSREVRQVARERLDEALRLLRELEDANGEDVEAAVHGARKRCKEVRALARLVRPAIGTRFDRFNDTVREAADTLAPIRDAHAVLATFDDLTSARGTGDEFATVRSGHAATAADQTATVVGGDPRIETACRMLSDARKQVKKWDVPDDFATARAGIEETYRRGRSGLRRASKRATDERMHDWRKAVKNLWYQVRLLERAAPSVLEPLVAQLDDLAEALGDDHDLAVLIERIEADPDRFGGSEQATRAIALARTQQNDLRRRAFRLGATVYVETTSAFADRIAAYWACTIEQGSELSTGGIAQLAEDEADHADGSERAAPGTGVERERKFLVADLPDLPEPGTPLRQGYLAVDGTVSVRVRDAGDCTLTLKAGRGAVRTELEWPLSREQFDAAWEQTGGRRINKTRYELPCGDHVAEIDVFRDDLHGLVLAEVEFGSDEELAAFEPPDWFGREVTDDVSYTNASLAMNAKSS